MPVSQETYLIVGGDSLIGRGLAAAWKSEGRRVLTTTRRPEKVGGDAIFLDLLRADELQIPNGLTQAVVCAAAVGYEDCEDRPRARQINVEMTPRLIGRLLAKRVRVNYLSSRFIFSSDQPWPMEDAPAAPDVAYGRHKQEAEEKLLELARRSGVIEQMVITRLTKVLAPETPPIPAWFQAWKAGRPVRPFTDFRCAPLPLDYVTASIAKICDSGLAGIFHLSGEASINYAVIAEHLAERLGLAADLVTPASSVQAGVKLFYAPRETGLDMSRTTALTGLRPAPLARVVETLAEHYFRLE